MSTVNSYQGKLLTFLPLNTCWWSISPNFLGRVQTAALTGGENAV